MRAKALVLVIVLCVLAALSWAVNAQETGRQRDGAAGTPKSLMSEGGPSLSTEGLSIADVVADR